MGCHQDHTSNTIFDSVVPRLERIEGNGSLNEEMSKFEIIFKELEEVRYNFSRSYGNMIYNSGAIVARKPSLCHAIIGLFYITARDMTVFIALFL